MMTDVAPMREDWERQGTWERASWHVAVLAGELGLELDAEAIILSDVRDLLTRRGQLRRQLTRGAWPGRWLRAHGG